MYKSSILAKRTRTGNWWNDPQNVLKISPNLRHHTLIKQNQSSSAGRTRLSHKTPHRLYYCQGQLTLPKSKNGDHFSIVTWVLQSTFAKQFFRSKQLDPRNKKNGIHLSKVVWVLWLTFAKHVFLLKQHFTTFFLYFYFLFFNIVNYFSLVIIIYFSFIFIKEKILDKTIEVFWSYPWTNNCDTGLCFVHLVNCYCYLYVFITFVFYGSEINQI